MILELPWSEFVGLLARSIADTKTTQPESPTWIRRWKDRLTIGEVEKPFKSQVTIPSFSNKSHTLAKTHCSQAKPQTINCENIWGNTFLFCIYINFALKTGFLTLSESVSEAYISQFSQFALASIMVPDLKSLIWWSLRRTHISSVFSTCSDSPTLVFHWVMYWKNTRYQNRSAGSTIICEQNMYHLCKITWNDVFCSGKWQSPIERASSIFFSKHKIYFSWQKLFFLKMFFFFKTWKFV